MHEFGAPLMQARPHATASLTISTLRLSLGPMIALGLARFAYAIVLPAMRADLALSFTQTGALGTANAAGTLVGTLVTAGAVPGLGQGPSDRRVIIRTFCVFAI